MSLQWKRSSLHERIRRVVLQVIEERERQIGQTRNEVVSEKDSVKVQEHDMIMSLDENALKGIMDSLTAFQKA